MMRPSERLGIHGVWTLSLALLLVVGTAGCAARSNRALEEARLAYVDARSDPTVVHYAPVPLQEAGNTIDEAEQEFADGDQEEVTHLSYVAQQQIARARQVAAEKNANAEAESLSESRKDVIIAAREQKIDEVLAQLAALNARETSQGIALTVSDVFFEFDRADLKPGAKQDLRQLAMFLMESPGRNVVIEGHTDSIGTDAYNVDLSQRRAMAVRSYLVAQGVDPSRLVAKGYGENYPVASNENPAGRQENRRVEMLVMNPGREITISGSAPVIVR